MTKSEQIKAILNHIENYDIDEYFDLKIYCDGCKKYKFFSLRYGIECDCS